MGRRWSTTGLPGLFWTTTETLAVVHYSTHYRATQLLWPKSGGSLTGLYYRATLNYRATRLLYYPATVLPGYPELPGYPTTLNYPATLLPEPPYNRATATTGSWATRLLLLPRYRTTSYPTTCTTATTELFRLLYYPATLLPGYSTLPELLYYPSYPTTNGKPEIYPILPGSIQYSVGTRGGGGTQLLNYWTTRLFTASIRNKKRRYWPLPGYRAFFKKDGIGQLPGYRAFLKKGGGGCGGSLTELLGFFQKRRWGVRWSTYRATGLLHKKSGGGVDPLSATALYYDGCPYFRDLFLDDERKLMKIPQIDLKRHETVHWTKHKGSVF